MPLATLADIAGVSPCYFNRLFRNSFGLPPHQYVLKHRLALARDLLKDKRRPIADIAATTGFSAQSHLTRHFKRQFGATPQQWRED